VGVCVSTLKSIKCFYINNFFAVLRFVANPRHERMNPMHSDGFKVVRISWTPLD